jgi:hypothetical protein
MFESKLLGVSDVFLNILPRQFILIPFRSQLRLFFLSCVCLVVPTPQGFDPSMAPRAGNCLDPIDSRSRV